MTINEDTAPASHCTISNIRYTQTSPEEQRTGLLGWIACTLNGNLHLDGIALRRTMDGELRLSFPARKDSMGTKHFYYHPLHEDARRAIECQIFQTLGIQETSP